MALRVRASEYCHSFLEARANLLLGTLKGQKLGEENADQLQDDTVDTAGGLVGKGGIGESIGAGVSKVL